MNYTESEILQARCFLDTNILVYALNKVDRQKSSLARSLLRFLGRNGNGIISEQVLQELFNVLVKKLKISRTTARAMVSRFAQFELLFSDEQNFRSTLDLAALYNISIWDAHIISSAISSKAKFVLSEDLQSGQDFHGVVVWNPFK
jgi:predicted nucleic acid-binding protein